MISLEKTSCMDISNLRKLQSYLCGTNVGTTPIVNRYIIHNIPQIYKNING